jgi:hypothetical protein
VAGEVVVDDYIVEKRSQLGSLHEENHCGEEKLVVPSARGGVARIVSEVDFLRQRSGKQMVSRTRKKIPGASVLRLFCEVDVEEEEIKVVLFRCSGNLNAVLGDGELEDSDEVLPVAHGEVEKREGKRSGVARVRNKWS